MKPFYFLYISPFKNRFSYIIFKIFLVYYTYLPIWQIVKCHFRSAAKEKEENGQQRSNARSQSRNARLLPQTFDRFILIYGFLTEPRVRSSPCILKIIRRMCLGTFLFFYIDIYVYLSLVILLSSSHFELESIFPAQFFYLIAITLPLRKIMHYLQPPDCMLYL